MSSVAQSLLTAEEFGQLPEDGARRELVRGEVIESMPPGGVHGAIAVALATMLRAWVGATGGYVGVEAGYVLARNPDTVRGPDVSYVRADRIPPGGVPEAFWPMAPDLAVEIVSPGETADEVRAKVRDYLAAGTPLVWTIYPRTREVVVHTSDGLARAYSDSDVIEHPDVLPGFTCPVAELFA
jgi:Uma2 family endonuclease